MCKRFFIFLTFLLSTPLLASNAIHPQRLHKGDTVALISSGSAVRESGEVKLAIKRLKALGLQVKLGKTVYQREGTFAGSDQARAEDINTMFADPNIKGIIELRGGWGSARTFPYLNFNAIKKHPKIIMGFSDITSLLLAIHKKTGLVTFHGPMAAAYEWPNYTNTLFKSMLMDAKLVTLQNPADHAKIHLIQPGEVTGEIIGGNLSVLTTMLGTPYAPDFKGKILFVEDIFEEVYKIDRMLNQLKQAGALSHIKGFIFGTCAHCTRKSPGSYRLEQILDHYIKPLGIPSWSGAMIGHQPDMFIIPEGAEVAINANAGTVRLLKPAVSGNV